MDFTLLFGCSIMGLMAHGSAKFKWLEWILRGLICIFFLLELNSALMMRDSAESLTPWAGSILFWMSLVSGAILLLPVRIAFSLFFPVLDGIVSLRFITGPIRHKLSVWASIMNQKIFQPHSVPHMVGLFIYLTTFAYLMQAINPANMQFPAIPLPVPITPGQLFSYHGIGLVLTSLCGVGILVKRNWREALARIGWVKPTWKHVAIGVGLVVFSFCYDLVWAYYTHGSADADMASKISNYNSTTFGASDNFSASVILALATAIFAGVGEETLMRGVLQPALGIFPAAVLHGLMHAQFTYAPVLIIQIALWSCVMGIVRRFTNTTTTIIGHAGFNLVTTFLFSYNP